MRTSVIDPQAVGGQTVSVSQFVPELREKFLAPAADVVRLNYEGMLGERRIHEPLLLTAKGKHIAVDVPQDVHQEFICLCVALLEMRFPHWSAAEGSEGHFLWDLASDTLTHTHWLRVLPNEVAEGIAPVTCEFDELRDSDIPF